MSDDELDVPQTAVRLRAEALIAPGIAAWDQKQKPFNDQVTEAVKQLLQTSKEFPLLVLSTSNSETVEGSMLLDAAKAMFTLRESVPGDSPIALAQGTKLLKSMRVALKRLHLSRNHLQAVAAE